VPDLAAYLEHCPDADDHAALTERLHELRSAGPSRLS
jgi:regulator of sirC expression with transglutaminase-like and TPR domain